jgi:hypothetical protein
LKEMVAFNVFSSFLLFYYVFIRVMNCKNLPPLRVVSEWNP